MKSLAVLVKHLDLDNGKHAISAPVLIYNTTRDHAEEFAIDTVHKITETCYVDSFYNMYDPEDIKTLVMMALDAKLEEDQSNPFYKIGEKLINFIREM